MAYFPTLRAKAGWWAIIVYSMARVSTVHSKALRRSTYDMGLDLRRNTVPGMRAQAKTLY